jgi:putative transposase
MKQPRYDRRSIRLEGFDYSQPGAYFLTICAAEQKCIFGKVEDGLMHENALGKIAHGCWLQIPDHFANAEIDAFVVMPNHFHAIIKLKRVIGRPSALKTESFGVPLPLSIPTIVRTFKAGVTRDARRILGDSVTQIWQRNYFERVIRNGKEYDETYRYIAENPLRWSVDEENPLLGNEQ